METKILDYGKVEAESSKALSAKLESESKYCTYNAYISTRMSHYIVLKLNAGCDDVKCIIILEHLLYPRSQKNIKMSLIYHSVVGIVFVSLYNYISITANQPILYLLQAKFENATKKNVCTYTV